MSKVKFRVGIPYIVLVICCILYGQFLLIFKNFCKGRNYFVICSILLLIMITVSGNIKADWQYLYLDSKEYLEECKKYAEEDCLFIHDGCQWKAGPAYKEISNFKSVTFISELKQIQHKEFEDNDCLVVMIVDEDEKFLQDIMQKYPQLNKYKYIGKFGYTKTYYLSNDMTVIE